MNIKNPFAKPFSLDNFSILTTAFSVVTGISFIAFALILIHPFSLITVISIICIAALDVLLTIVLTGEFSTGDGRIYSRKEAGE